MLFKRLYNWIKYKTLPTSFLFKNRLFIERDSKHRRIFSNLGLSFRNSKWSNYETYNIKLQFKKNYLKFFFWITFFIFSFFFLFYFKKYYIFSYFFNSISFLFWISIDTFDYYFTFVVWLVFISVSLFFKLIYSYFFYNNFFNTNPNKEIFSHKPFYYFDFNLNSLFFSSNDLKISKNDLNWVMYSWLVNSSSNKKDLILEKLFETKINKQWWGNYYDFFIKLYKLSYFLNLSSENFNIFNLNLKLKKISNKFYRGDYLSTVNFFNNSSILNSNSSLVYYYILNNYQNYFSAKNKKNFSLNHLNTRFNWNLYNLNQELDQYSYLVKSKAGMFFLDDFNYQKLSHYIFNYKELWSLNLYLKNQLNSAKWNRWLYRYSILHRKSLRTSHKITLSKKLINSGFYDSKIFNKNIWASEHLNYLNQKNNFNSLFFNYYKDLFAETGTNYVTYYNSYVTNNGNQKNSLSLFNFYENSYFWYLKRFYLFNTLPSNFIKSKLTLNNLNSSSKFLLKNDSSLRYFTLLSYFLKSSHTNLASYSHFFDTNVANFDLYSSSNLINLGNYKDLYLLNNENDILNRDNLNLLYWITSNSSKNNNLIFFNYLNSLGKTDNVFPTLFYKSNNDIFSLNYWLLYSLINVDKFFVNDAVYLSLFN